MTATGTASRTTTGTPSPRPRCARCGGPTQQSANFSSVFTCLAGKHHEACGHWWRHKDQTKKRAEPFFTPSTMTADGEFHPSHSVEHTAAMSWLEVVAVVTPETAVEASAAVRKERGTAATRRRKPQPDNRLLQRPPGLTGKVAGDCPYCEAGPFKSLANHFAWRHREALEKLRRAEWGEVQRKEEQRRLERERAEEEDRRERKRIALLTDPRTLDIVRRLEAGETLKAAGAAHGITAERARQLSHKWFKLNGTSLQEVRQSQREAERREREAAELAETERRLREGPWCVVCGEAILRSNSHGATCSPGCAAEYHSHRWRYSEAARRRQRLAVARSALRHPERHTPARLAYAQRVVDEPNRPFRTPLRMNGQ